MTTKHRLSASVDAVLVDAAERAVARGDAPNLSAWVNDALALKLEHDRKIAAMNAFVAAWEAEHGVITEAEMNAAARAMSARAVTVRGKRPRPKRAPAR